MKPCVLSVLAVCAVGAVVAGCSAPDRSADAAPSASARVEATETTAASPSTPPERTPSDPADFGRLFDRYVASGVPVVDWARSVCQAFDRGESTSSVETSLAGYLENYPPPGDSASWVPADSQFLVDNSVTLYCPEHLTLIDN
ncbi:MULTISPECIES: DUF732 domain-containing protein [Rhodococcus]|uniref:DUF732 domain-containing protein n=1 Tax=Nocardiaceae TaxID=85025 RepID=UPI000AFBC0E9|nr:MULTISPECIES: DUF732 domain-containing protein [Rhodococcus]NIL76654.1 hypothetical protein [Rhodococcus sp. B10]